MKRSIIFIIVGMLGAIVVFTSVFVATLSNNNSSSVTTSPSAIQEKPKPKETAESTIKQDDSPTNYGSHRQEMLELFQGIFQKNKFKSIYAGIKHETSPSKLAISPPPDTLTVYVRDEWNYLSKDIKKEFIETAFIAWGTSAKARNIEINMKYFKIEFVHENSNRKVATWDGTWGEDIL